MICEIDRSRDANVEVKFTALHSLHACVIVLFKKKLLLNRKCLQNLVLIFAVYVDLRKVFAELAFTHQALWIRPPIVHIIHVIILIKI